MRKHISIICFILVSLSSCVKEQLLGSQVEDCTVFTATTVETKTSIGDKDAEGHRAISWVAEDKVAVHDGTKVHQAAAENGGAETKLVVNSSLASENYYAVYPYNEGFSVSGNVIGGVSLPQVQDGTFSDSHYAVATTTSDKMTFAFENICSWVRFLIDADTYVSATFKGNGNETVSGTVDATFEGGALKSVALSGSVKIVALEAENGGYLPGECYLTLAPGVSLPDGFTIELEDAAGEVSKIQSVKPLSIERGAMANLGDILTKRSMIGGTVTVDGTPRAGVAISDGYSIYTTDANGKYSFVPSKDAIYVYYSIPADVKIECGTDGLPCFHSKIESGKQVYDFNLTSTPVETDFRLLALGDPQVKRATENKGIERLENESIADVKAYVESKGGDMPTYAIVMGDYTHNRWDLLSTVAPLFAQDKVGVPCFAVIGNHDHEFAADGSISDLQAQRNFETYMGPVNYSFDRGNVHIVVVDDVIHGGTTENECSIGFSDAVRAWLAADLALVPKTKAVILCMHGNIETDDIYSTLKGFASYRVICGHDHYVRNLTNSSYLPYYKIPVHVVGALNGVDWRGTICGGGEPMGYASFEYSGTTLKNHIYKAVRYPESYQIRMYRPDEFKDKEFDMTYDDVTRHYCFGIYGADKIVANIWNASDSWKSIKIVEDGVERNSMTKFTETGTRYDLWSCWYFYKVAGGITTSYGRANEHMYYGTLVNPSASEIKIRAVDAYGNTFEQNAFTRATPLYYPDVYRDAPNFDSDSYIEDAPESDYSWN